MPASACKITLENLSVIASENPKFDRDELLAWIEEYETGYFLREEGSAFDCKYISTTVFLMMYKFVHKDEDALFRKVEKLRS